MREFVCWVHVCVCIAVRLPGPGLMGFGPCIADRKSMTHSVGPILLLLYIEREGERGIKAGGRLTICKHYGFMSVAYDRVVTHLLSLNLNFHCEL